MPRIRLWNTLLPTLLHYSQATTSRCKLHPDKTQQNTGLMQSSFTKRAASSLQWQLPYIFSIHPSSHHQLQEDHCKLFYFISLSLSNPFFFITSCFIIRYQPISPWGSTILSSCILSKLQ